MIVRSLAVFLCALILNGQTTASFPELLAKAHAGDGQAAYALGKMYENPRTAGSPPDLKGAAYWYTQASKKGVQEATVDLARFYLTGLGVPRDDTKAFDLYESAANAGYAPAMTRLAEVMIAKNYGGNGKYFGSPWIVKAANLGEPDALNDQGSLIINGAYGGYQVREAVASFEKAVQAGSCEALFNLGNVYLNGSYEGKFSQDGAKAQSYYARVRSCSSASSDLKQRAAVLEQSAARGELPPLRRWEPTNDATTNADKGILVWLTTMGAIAIVAKGLHYGESYGPNSQACWNVNNGLGGSRSSCICFTEACLK